jgi:hypothetical protein
MMAANLGNPYGLLNLLHRATHWWSSGVAASHIPPPTPHVSGVGGWSGVTIRKLGGALSGRDYQNGPTEIPAGPKDFLNGLLQVQGTEQ